MDAADEEGPRDAAAVDAGSPLPAGGGPSSPGGADPVGPDESPPLPAIVLDTLEAPAQRRASSGLAATLLDGLNRRVERKMPAIECAPEPEPPRPPSRTAVGSTRSPH